MELEYCFKCRKPTGHNDKDGNSLYCQATEEGPYCDFCYDQHLEDCMECRFDWS